MWSNQPFLLTTWTSWFSIESIFNWMRCGAEDTSLLNGFHVFPFRFCCCCNFSCFFFFFFFIIMHVKKWFTGYFIRWKKGSIHTCRLAAVFIFAFYMSILRIRFPLFFFVFTFYFTSILSHVAVFVIVVIPFDFPTDISNDNKRMEMNAYQNQRMSIQNKKEIFRSFYASDKSTIFIDISFFSAFWYKRNLHMLFKVVFIFLHMPLAVIGKR